MTRRPGRAPATRREFLSACGACGLATLGLGGLAACQTGPSGPPAPVEVPLAEIEAKGRVEVRLGDSPVEIRKTPRGLEARSLLCPHTGCHVRWREDRQDYRCTCHEGMFDEQGRVIQGPPPRALDAVALLVRDGLAVVGGASE
jgi:cytochrome b6-f complex iron-sulfur subunit